MLSFCFFKQKTAYEMRISDWIHTCALPIYWPCGWRGTDGWFGAYQIAMFEMRRDPNGAGPVISGFSGLGFRIQDTVFPNGLLLTPQEAAPWAAPSIQHLDVAEIAPLLALHPLPEFLLLGTGDTLIPPPRAFVRALEL